MNFFKKNIGFSEVVDEMSQRKGAIKDVFDGSVLTRASVTKQLPFILYITFLGVLYIANKYHAEKIVRETMKLQNEVRELRTEKIATQSELMSISKQSEVAKLVKERGLGLEESVEPPRKIILKED